MEARLAREGYLHKTGSPRLQSAAQAGVGVKLQVPRCLARHHPVAARRAYSRGVGTGSLCPRNPPALRSCGRGEGASVAGERPPR